MPSASSSSAAGLASPSILSRPGTITPGPRPAPQPPVVNGSSQYISPALSYNQQPGLPIRPPGYENHTRTLSNSSNGSSPRPPLPQTPDHLRLARPPPQPAMSPPASAGYSSARSNIDPNVQQNHNPYNEAQQPRLAPSNTFTQATPPQLHQSNQQGRLTAIQSNSSLQIQLPRSPAPYSPSTSFQKTQDQDLPISKPLAAFNILDQEEEPSNPFPGPAPVRPDNPELIQAKQALKAKLQAAFDHHLSAHRRDCASLQALQSDLEKGEPAIQDEMARLTAVRDVCVNVRDRYRDVVSRAEENVQELRTRPDPGIDEIVCSTTVVYNQYVRFCFLNQYVGRC